MKALSRGALIAAERSSARHASPSARPIEILQIGEGVFLRGLRRLDGRRRQREGRLSPAASRSPRPAAASGRPRCVTQDSLYTVLLRGREGGRDVAERRVVATVQTRARPLCAMERNAASSPPRRRCSSSSRTRPKRASSTSPRRTTRRVCPDSFPAKVAALLKARFDALGGSEAPGLVFLPCELIEAQRRDAAAHRSRACAPLGLRAAPSSHGSKTGAASSTRSSTGSCQDFPTEEAESAIRRMGLSRSARRRRRAVPSLGDRGRQSTIAEALPLARPARTSSGPTTSGPIASGRCGFSTEPTPQARSPAFLAGLDTVGEMIEDPQFARAVCTALALRRDRALRAAARSRATRLCRTVLERFGNPFVRHELISIAFNSVSKWRVRILPTVRRTPWPMAKAAPRR